MSRIKSVLFLLALAAQVPLASAAVTYAVGSCKPNLHSFTTINGALAATPPPNVVEVCPGTYNEQVVITQAVILEGIPEGILTGDSAQAIVAPPAGGLVANATDDLGNSLAVQIWVNNSAGPVNISGLAIDGTGNGILGGALVIGIFFQNSPGIVNHVTTRNQTDNGNGIGVWLEGGSANPTVTVENSDMHDFDRTAVFDETNSSISALTANIKSNFIDAGAGATRGIDLEEGATSNVTGNSITGGFSGIHAQSPGGSISSNTIMGTTIGIQDGSAASVTSNKIFTSSVGIEIFGAGGVFVQGNTIVGAAQDGINFQCLSTTTTDVHSNTIIDAGTGIANVPGAVVSSNSYLNVATIQSGGC
jgi:nitrous oxidase accessory protein NosD